MDETQGIDGMLEGVRDLIAEHGWMVMFVFGTEENPRMNFHYTVGLAAHGFPEIITYALPQFVGHDILNDLAARLVAGKRQPYVNGERLDDVVVDYPVVMLDCTERPPSFIAERIAEATAPHGLKVQQLITPDVGSLMPWEDGYEGVPVPLHGTPVEDV